MKVTVIGGGPGGLYFAIQLKKANSKHEIEVYERNARRSTFGWGVVFSDATLGNFLEADAETSHRITDGFHHWDDIEIFFRGKVIESSGHGFCGMGRKELLECLIDRAQSLGVRIHFDADVQAEDFGESDLVVAADGIFSKTRERYADQFGVNIDWRKCKYIWLGTERKFDAFTFLFKETPHGWFQAHCYQFSDQLSTFIVECPEAMWRAAGIDRMEKEEGIKFCEDLFAEELGGHKLISNAEHLRGSAAWISFPRVDCEKWYHKNIVLLGDAAASAHFSIGSGTKLAMESAIALAKIVDESSDIEQALKLYQEERKIEVLRLQSAARNSTEWFENVHLKATLDPTQFAYSLLTRSQRVSHENLRVRDEEYLRGVERWFTERSTGEPTQKAIPPMFNPFQLREVSLPNRVAVSPMATYSAVDGVPGDFHLVHLGARALGGAGLVFTEMTCVSPEARITPGCAGIYSDEQTEQWKRIVEFVHGNSPAKIAMQLGHSGRKGSTKIGWEGIDEPLPSGNWQLFSPSPLPHTAENQVPKEMTAQDLEKVLGDFVECTRRADVAGFDLLELHCAHGYLLSSFISPITNHRTDEYGGSLENRMRYPLQIFAAMREVWPKSKPISIRISASDWVPGGITIEDSVEIAAMCREHGVDIIDVSSGQVSPDQKPVYGRMYQTPFADRIRAEIGISTMAVGNIYESDHVNSIIAAGRADLCLLARPHLANPNWTQHAAAELDYEELFWPNQYLSGKQQLYTLTRRAKLMQTDPI